MKTTILLLTIILSFLPISELRGAIPYAVANGVSLWQAALIAFICNALVAPVAFVFLETFHKLLYRWSFYKKLFDRVVEKARIKISEKVQKYGYWGLLVFVAIPLPVTGAWTGSLGAWVLGMDKKKACMYIALGVAIAGVIVSLIVGLGIEALGIFLKKI